ncbi:hypothetical protein [Prochlorococcus sp. MIT 0801]|nr:hypothetical protein [Prochlorococcus sp. MIT 0801]AIQ97392.1 hypothetical protein EW15_1300 [Prochlorococcus sp. MIT 0801]
MKRLILSPLLLFLASPAQAEMIEKKTAEFFMKAADFAALR